MPGRGGPDGGGHEDDRFAVLHQTTAGRLLGQFAGFDRKSTPLRSVFSTRTFNVSSYLRFVWSKRPERSQWQVFCQGMGRCPCRLNLANPERCRRCDEKSVGRIDSSLTREETDSCESRSCRLDNISLSRGPPNYTIRSPCSHAPEVRLASHAASGCRVSESRDETCCTRRDCTSPTRSLTCECRGDESRPGSAADRPVSGNPTDRRRRLTIINRPRRLA